MKLPICSSIIITVINTQIIIINFTCIILNAHKEMLNKLNDNFIAKTIPFSNYNAPSARFCNKVVFPAPSRPKRRSLISLLWKNTCNVNIFDFYA